MSSARILSDRHDQEVPVSIITVSYNSGLVLGRLLDSLPKNSEIIVVDNASSDNSREIADQHGVQCVQLNRNLGFGTACNIGAKVATRRFVLFINPDAEADSSMIDALLDASKRFPRAAFNPRIYNGSKVSFRRRSRLIDPKHHWVDALPQSDAPIPVLSGACILMDRQAFLNLGGFDEEIFLYHEDDDLSLRLAHAGYDLVYVHRAILKHQAGNSSGKTFESGFIKGKAMALSMCHVAKKHALPISRTKEASVSMIKLLSPHILLTPSRRGKYLGLLAGFYDSTKANKRDVQQHITLVPGVPTEIRLSTDPTRIEFRSVRGTGPNKILLIDEERPDRSCLMHGTDRNCCYMDLATPISNGRLLLLTEGDESDERQIEVKVSSVSRLEYYQRFFKTSWLPDRLQRFSSNEKFFYTGISKGAARLAAQDNVELRALRLYRLDDYSLMNARSDWRAQLALTPHAPAMSGLTGSGKFGVYVHMHYLETWPDFEIVLDRLADTADLLISLSSDNPTFLQSLLSRFPKAKVVVLPNRGRDVGPFLELLHRRVFEGYDAVCKLHGKLSKKHGVNTLAGERIRRYCLRSLLHDEGFERAVDKFLKNPKLGLLGPSQLLLPPKGHSSKRYLRGETKILRQLCERAGMNFDCEAIDFFAGTMFWFRPCALEGLQNLSIKIDDFEEGPGPKRSTLHHALERFFNFSVRSAGYAVEGLEPSVVSCHGIEDFRCSQC